MNKIQRLQQRLQDHRSKQVIFLSHCILNENTRYLGGACRGGCVAEIVQQCLDHDWGIVQMPCPEQQAWGGVIKRWLLMAYGAKGTFLYPMRHLVLPLFLWYTHWHYRRLAQATATQINDYLVCGYSVIGVIGIDGSPTCGVKATLAIQRSFELMANLDIDAVTVEQMNSLIRNCVIDGRGLFTARLQEALKQRQIQVPFGAHDLIAELDGKAATGGDLSI